MSQHTVDPILICAWLNVPADQWPPDHYTLLGLKPGHSDPQLLETHTHERLARVRHYQLMHPEAATEAMNRIAQAFVCLSDNFSRQAYDRSLFGTSAVETQATAAIQTQEAAPAEAASPGAPTSLSGLLDLPELNAPVGAAPELFEVPDEEAAAEEVDPELLALVEEEIFVEEQKAFEAASATTSPFAEVVPAHVNDPVVEAAQRSRQARKGLGSKRAFYARLARTRALSRVWEEAGKYLFQPEKRLRRPAEARELLRALANIRRELENFPKLLGEAGQPGYLVISLARQPSIVPTFQTLLPSQREALARDGLAGLKLLQAHRDFLRHELKSLRRTSVLGRTVRSTRQFINDHPAGLLLLYGLLALALALWNQFF